MKPALTLVPKTAPVEPIPFDVWHRDTFALSRLYTYLCAQGRPPAMPEFLDDAIVWREDYARMVAAEGWTA